MRGADLVNHSELSVSVQHIALENNTLTDRLFSLLIVFRLLSEQR